MLFCAQFLLVLRCVQSIEGGALGSCLRRLLTSLKSASATLLCIRCFSQIQGARKFICGQGFASNPAGGLVRTLQDHIVGWHRVTEHIISISPLCFDTMALVDGTATSFDKLSTASELFCLVS